MRVLRNSALYTIIAVLQRAIGFFLLPLYTALLSPTDYGVIAVVTSITSILSLLFTMSMHGAVSRFFYEYEDENLKKRFLGTIVLFVLCLSASLGAIFLIFNRYLLAPLAQGIPFKPFLLLGLISTILAPMYLLYQTTLQVQHLANKYTLNGFLFFICNISLSLLFIVVFKFKAEGILLAGVITNIIFFIHALINLSKKISLIIDKSMLKRAILYSLPLVPHSLSGWIMSMIDRIFINNMISSASAGIYNVGAQFGGLINIINFGITQAYSPWLMEILTKNEKQKIPEIRDFVLVITAILCILGLGLSLFSPIAISIMASSNYKDSWKVVPFLAFGAVFNGLYTLFIGSVFYQDSRYVPIISAVSSLASVILNWLLIGTYGIFGASISNLLANFIASIFACLISKKIYNMKFDIKSMYILVLFAFLGSCFVFIDIDLRRKIYISIIIILVYSLSVYKIFRGNMLRLLKKGKSKW